MELTSQDRSQLRKLESVIEKRIATFVEVGEALRTIRDSKLYRDDYGTFERYVEDRWQFKKRYAYNLIESAEAVKNVHHGAQKTVPANERQARELAKAPPEKQAEVWEELVADNPKPTAKDVKAAVARHKEEPETIEAVAVSVVKDGLGRDVPESLREKYAIGAQLSAIGRKLDVVKREAVELADTMGGWFIPVQQIELAAKALKDLITESAYWTACPRCSGKGCKRCDSSGFIPKSKKNMLSNADKEDLGL